VNYVVIIIILEYPVFTYDIYSTYLKTLFTIFICLQAHSSVEKAGLIGLVKMRFIESDDSLSLRGAQVMEAIAIDKKQNLIPFFVSIKS